MTMKHALPLLLLVALLFAAASLQAEDNTPAPAVQETAATQLGAPAATPVAETKDAPATTASSTVPAALPGVFSHKRHLAEGTSCADCHGSEAKDLSPRAESCSSCHDTPKAIAPAETKNNPNALRFPHDRHAASLECSLCHKDLAEDKEAKGGPRLGFDDCQRCHKEKGIRTPEGQCARCHDAARTQLAPRDHAKAWKRAHGGEAGWRVFDEHGKDCHLCHSAGSCTNCHREVRPQDHGAAWNARTHGQSAQWDRERCKTCHESGFCINCHRDTSPMSHMGNWRYLHGKALGDSGSCTECHNKGMCYACHQEGLR